MHDAISSMMVKCYFGIIMMVNVSTTTYYCVCKTKQYVHKRRINHYINNDDTTGKHLNGEKSKMNILLAHSVHIFCLKFSTFKITHHIIQFSTIAYSTVGIIIMFFNGISRQDMLFHQYTRWCTIMFTLCGIFIVVGGGVVHNITLSILYTYYIFIFSRILFICLC